MPMYTPIRSLDDLKPFDRCFVSLIKPTGEDSTAYYSHDTRELWLIRNTSIWFTVDEFEAMGSDLPIRYMLELQERYTKGLITLDHPYFKECLKTQPIQLAHLSAPEIQRHITLFQNEKISLFPNAVCPDRASALHLLEAQRKKNLNQVVEPPANKINFQAIIKETLSKLKAQPWKSLPVQVTLEPWEASDKTIRALAKPSELYILSAEISLPFNEADRKEIRAMFSSMLKREEEKWRLAKQNICFSIEASGQQARLLIQAFSSAIIQKNQPMPFISELEESLLKASDPLSFDHFTPPPLTAGQFGLFPGVGKASEPMKAIHFFDELIPYAGQIVFYETLVCQPKGAHDWYDCIKLGDQYVFPAYISRYLSDDGLNNSYKLSQFDCQYHSSPITEANSQGNTSGLDAYTLGEMKLHLRLPKDDELIQLKKAHEEGLLKLIINKQRACSQEEFFSVVDKQLSKFEQRPAEQNLRLSS